jgi:N-ethylmaleimide reductase
MDDMTTDTRLPGTVRATDADPLFEPYRVGPFVRLSPMGKLNDIHDDNPEATFGYIAERLSDYGFAYLHIVNPALEQMQGRKEPDPRALNMVKLIRKKIRGDPGRRGRLSGRPRCALASERMGRLDRFRRKFIAIPICPSG